MARRCRRGERLRSGVPHGHWKTTTLVAGLATAPFAIYHFNRFAEYGLLANLAAVPLIGLWVMPGGLLALLLMPFGLEELALEPMGLGLQAIDWIAASVAALILSRTAWGSLFLD